MRADWLSNSTSRSFDTNDGQKRNSIKFSVWRNTQNKPQKETFYFTLSLAKSNHYYLKKTKQNKTQFSHVKAFINIQLTKKKNMSMKTEFIEFC